MLLYSIVISFFINFILIGKILYNQIKKSKKLEEKINILQHIVDESPLIFNTKIQDQINDLKDIINKKEDNINQKLDKRTQAIYNNIDLNKKEILNILREILTNWENSEEFRMMLNQVRKEENKSNSGINY